MVKRFADDTTILKVGNDLVTLVNDFSSSIINQIEWCKFNRIDINWSKTKIMFVTNKRNICLPKCIKIYKNVLKFI